MSNASTNDEVHMGREKTRKKVAIGITDKIERRIVDLSLRHHDFGANRLLPLLNKENIIQIEVHPASSTD